MKAVVAAFNQEKALVGALVGAFSVITNLQMELFEALEISERAGDNILLTPGEGWGGKLKPGNFSHFSLKEKEV